MPTLADLMDTIYEDLFAYTTIKVVKTKDWRLSAMKRIFNMCVLVYVLFVIVFYHGYLFKEVPVVSVATTLTGASLITELQNLSYTFGNGGYPPEYCGTAASPSAAPGTAATSNATAPPVTVRPPPGLPPLARRSPTPPRDTRRTTCTARTSTS